MANRDEEPERVLLPELCDLCGVLICDGSELYGLVADPSAVHEPGAGTAGLRLVAACNRDHLDKLREKYRRRSRP